MKKVLVFVVFLAMGGLSGCGDTCNSSAAEAKALPASCSLSPGSGRSIEVQLCAKCSESSPSCVGEYRNGVIELDTAFKECQADAGCPSTACSTDKVTCLVDIPAGAAGAVPVLAGANQKTGTVTVASSGAGSCSL